MDCVETNSTSGSNRLSTNLAQAQGFPDKGDKTGGRAFEGHPTRCFIPTVAVFHLPLVERSFADHNPVRDSQKVAVGELHSGPDLTIVEQDFHILCLEL